MKELKPVKSRIVFFKNKFQEDNEPEYGNTGLNITSTFNMTIRDFKDRQPDMLVETGEGQKILLDKSIIVGIKEIKVVAQEVEEVKKK